ncbi:hypothetical protein SAMN02746065_1181 [Desulfocicer vacuolatum DSM 3385]|uniref:DUF4276 family protein n=1 Tax=Desulfocicer vacuolatum DSM 3385 TaxID=1121400 RepID=A0A1W2DIE1_9BACT|nr:hypothetical protein [Desulfocicer vacuolatum]SMC97277.1 hypothetical protein SAMN02746065_1181 [Desulfocicer vacuolatum DSM 3385]
MKQKPGPKPGKTQKAKALGKTGKDLASQISYFLPVALQNDTCDLVLVLDDLDCRDEINSAAIFNEAIDGIHGTENIDRCVAFAAPEIESWLIADWQNTFAVDYRFRAFHEGLRHRLSSFCKILFDNPESFSEFNPDTDACREKLSDVLIKAVQAESEERKLTLPHFSKREHSPELLMIAKAQIIQQKCPIFAKFYHYLKDHIE